VACSQFKETGKQKHKRPITITKKVYISPTWGDAPLEPIATKFGNSLYLTEVISRLIFGVDWFSSFGSGEAQNLMFLIGQQLVLTTAALPRLHVINAISYNPRHPTQAGVWF